MHFYNCDFIKQTQTIGEQVIIKKLIFKPFGPLCSDDCTYIYCCCCARSDVAHVRLMWPRYGPSGARGHNSGGDHMGSPYGAHKAAHMGPTRPQHLLVTGTWLVKRNQWEALKQKFSVFKLIYVAYFNLISLTIYY